MNRRTKLGHVTAAAEAAAKRLALAEVARREVATKAVASQVQPPATPTTQGVPSE